MNVVAGESTSGASKDYRCTFGIAVVISGTKLTLIAKAEDVLQFLFFWKVGWGVGDPPPQLLRP